MLDGDGRGGNGGGGGCFGGEWGGTWSKGRAAGGEGGAASLEKEWKDEAAHETAELGGWAWESVGNGWRRVVIGRWVGPSGVGGGRGSEGEGGETSGGAKDVSVETDAVAVGAGGVPHNQGCGRRGSVGAQLQLWRGKVDTAA
ncbi:hypothetical protein CYMTET_7206 [Cymbomonas tetramitiformis]|uniref:Uncharacterized protein n=2 Tax=Cymbomonas tetramitiformis TaxID=36881 RepID=A0AAE0GVG8_9CHLO|nr:hypothetical protein CYMTET_7206 [Cymbomonas tetramitiformis]